MKPLRFEISLIVLNHLGRNLYRSFATILGEAISNAWDAEAENVRISYDSKKHRMRITDDGIGMSRDDLQDKFLKIGYSKREALGDISDNKKRPYIGRKGIGKLALLSCADRVVVLSKKTTDEKWNGVVIDNQEIDQKIEKDSGVADYNLREPNLNDYKEELRGANKGTVVCFEGLKEKRKRTEEFLHKTIALYFRFSLIDHDFKIFLNDKEVTIAALKGLADKTQFVWNINDYASDPYLETVKPACDAINLRTKSEEIQGFIASVEIPTNLKIFGAKERVGVDLFVNGRMREVDILKRFPSSRIPEQYLYGQIHINSLDSSDEVDRFTTSREGMQADDPTYEKYLDEIKALVLKVINQWDGLRDKYDYDGELDRGQSEVKKAKSLYREIAKKFIDGLGDKVSNKFIKDLTHDAAYNSSSYVHCFITENLLRRHIDENDTVLTSCQNTDPDGKTCKDRHPDKVAIDGCPYCKGEQGRQNLQGQKETAGTSIQIRSDEDNVLMYLDYIDLANFIDNKILRDEDKPYRPLRNSVMHTSRLTSQARTKLTSVFDNVVATVKKLATTDTKKKP